MRARVRSTVAAREPAAVVRVIRCKQLWYATGRPAHVSGVRDPAVYADWSLGCLVDTDHWAASSDRAILEHEAAHVIGRHGAKAVAVAVLTLGLLRPLWRRRCEARADARVLALMGPGPLLAMLERFGPPKTRMGRFHYGSTVSQRAARAARAMCRMRRAPRRAQLKWI